MCAITDGLLELPGVIGPADGGPLMIYVFVKIEISWEDEETVQPTWRCPALLIFGFKTAFWNPYGWCDSGSVYSIYWHC